MHDLSRDTPALQTPYRCILAASEDEWGGRVCYHVMKRILFNLVLLNRW